MKFVFVLGIALLALSCSAFAQEVGPGVPGPPPPSPPERCEPNGTPCNYKGIGGWTNCCTKFCLQDVNEPMGRCANPE